MLGGLSKTVDRAVDIQNKFFKKRSDIYYSAVQGEYDEELKYYKKVNKLVNTVDLGFLKDDSKNEKSILNYRCKVYKKLKGIIIVKSSWQSIFE